MNRQNEREREKRKKERGKREEKIAEEAERDALLRPGTRCFTMQDTRFRPDGLTPTDLPSRETDIGF